MPTYEYACTACGHQLEAVQSFTDEPLSQCPVCGGKLRKVFSSVGIVFKGSGFYRTDSRRGEESNGTRKETAPAGRSSGSDSAGSGTSTSGSAATAGSASKSGSASGSSEGSGGAAKKD